MNFDSILVANNFNGVAIVVKDKDTLFAQARGVREVEDNIGLEFNDQFVIGSISKQITAVMVLQAYEKDLLNLTDTIGVYFPEVEQPWANEVTIHHLLTHTHGIVGIDTLATFEAGSQFNYSQLGYDLLASILEQVTGKNLDSLSHELFTSCGMNDSCHPDNRTYKRRVKGYEEDENQILQYTDASLQNFVAAGGFISTAPDLVKWNMALHGRQLLSDSSMRLMSTPYATRQHPVFGEIEYGYGLLFKKGEEKIQIGALGYAPGFASSSYYFPTTNSQVIVLSNMVRGIEDFKKVFTVHTELMRSVSNN